MLHCPLKYLLLYLLQQQMSPQTRVAEATTIMNDAIVTYKTLHSKRDEKHRYKNIIKHNTHFIPQILQISFIQFL